jgi:AraC-like DNA-binding protein/mannose-6-phosphate isomerase-like protein (cupin superfamily)
MTHNSLPWKKAYLVVEPGINAEGVHTYRFDPAFPIDVGFFVHAGRHNVRMNRHDYSEVIYVYGGRTDIQVLNRFFRVKEGDLMVVGPDLYHRILNRPRMEVKLISLNFQPEIIRGSDASTEEEQYLMPFLCQDSQFPHVISPSTGVPSKGLELILKVHSELPAKTSLARLAVRTYMKMLLLLLVKHYTDYLGTRETFDKKRHDIERLEPLFSFLEENHGRRIRVSDAARVCAMSCSRFMSYFKRVTGQSFLAYLSSFRIAKAQALLSTTNKPIAEISGLLAFCSQSYFGKVFHSLVGLTPRAYRRRYGKSHGAISESHNGPVPQRLKDTSSKPQKSTAFEVRLPVAAMHGSAFFTGSARGAERGRSAGIGRPSKNVQR